MDEIELFSFLYLTTYSQIVGDVWLIYLGVHIKISPSVLKQSISNIYSQTSCCGFQTEATLSGL